jgi:ubiquinone/menaquinone biosynthesis C-methylase UbiE
VLEGGTLAVDGLGQTSVPGIYAIGDMARRETMLPGHQVAAAAAEGSLTAIAIDPISSSAISRGCDRMNDSRNPMTERVHHPLFARAYTRIAAHAEGRGAADHRRQLLAGLTGRVIEVGAGSGANFPYYPGTVDEVVACEPEPYLRAQAAEAATHTALPITVIDGVADVLPVPSESFDAAVVALVLCTVPDVPSALAEVRRVLKPGGELRFYEHVISDRPVTARLQQLADATFWPRVAGGCHMSRDTAAAISDSGFRIEQCDRFPFSPIRFLPSDPHILGVARRG